VADPVRHGRPSASWPTQCVMAGLVPAIRRVTLLQIIAGTSQHKAGRDEWGNDDGSEPEAPGVL
jgi:hypothetical protein